MVGWCWGERRASRHLIAFAMWLAAGCLEAPPEAPGPPDTPPPEADAATGEGASCDAFFGSAPDYVLCQVEEGACHFYLQLFDGVDFTCTMACAEFGVACLDGFSDTDQEDPCEIDQQEGCESEHEDQICVCALP